MDYDGELHETLMFGPCDIRQCVNVTIIDDLVIEEDEKSFHYRLWRTSDLSLSIDLNSANGEVVIWDNDG